MPIHLANQERLLASLPPAERRRLEGLLRKLLAGLERPPAPTSGRGARRRAT
jgi:hypothetical protein